MIDEPITSKLAKLLYNVYEVPYLTCLAIQEDEAKAKKYDELEDLLEKYEIKDLAELEIALDQYYHRYDKVETRRVG